MTAKRFFRVETIFANRRREFASEADARAYAHELFRADARLGQVLLVEVTENTAIIRREEKAA